MDPTPGWGGVEAATPRRRAPPHDCPITDMDWCSNEYIPSNILHLLTAVLPVRFPSQQRSLLPLCSRVSVFLALLTPSFLWVVHVPAKGLIPSSLPRCLPWIVASRAGVSTAAARRLICDELPYLPKLSAAQKKAPQSLVGGNLCKRGGGSLVSMVWYANRKPWTGS